MHPDWTQCIPCSVAKWIPIECSGFDAAWPNGSRLNAGDSMQRVWMQCIPCSVKKWNPIECKDFMQHYWMQWIQKARLNAVDFMQHGPKHPDWMQWNPCRVLKCIPIECIVFPAVWRNGTLLNAVDFMQHDWMQWVLCSMAKSIPIECSGLHALWLNAV